MKVRDALYHAVHDYAGGVEELAGRMGVAASTLQNTANPRQETHEWSLKRIKQVVDFTGDLRIAHAFAAECGGLFLPVPAGGGAADADVFRRAMKLAMEFGDVVRELDLAMADGRMTQHERERIHQQIYELGQAAHNVGLEVDRLASLSGPLKAVK